MSVFKDSALMVTSVLSLISVCMLLLSNIDVVVLSDVVLVNDDNDCVVIDGNDILLLFIVLSLYLQLKLLNTLFNNDCALYIPGHCFLYM